MSIEREMISKMNALLHAQGASDSKIPERASLYETALLPPFLPEFILRATDSDAALLLSAWGLEPNSDSDSILRRQAREDALRQDSSSSVSSLHSAEEPEHRGWHEA